MILWSRVRYLPVCILVTILFLDDVLRVRYAYTK